MFVYVTVLSVAVLGQVVFGQLQPTRACSIQITIDTFLWEEFFRQTDHVDKDERENLAWYNAVSLAGRLVNTANKVISDHFLNGNKYKLLLKDVQILKSTEDCGDLCSDELDQEGLLNMFSSVPRDSYCLAYLLTYRSWAKGRLGLAYTATPFHGGVCETFRPQKEVVYGYEREVNKSLNTGVVSLNRNGRRVSEQVAALTFAHEIGHSLGSPHDPESCYGNQEDGTYLMHQGGSLGSQKNNMVLSTCSLKTMANVLSSLDLRESGSCWGLDSRRGTCGNSIIEVWEECDCGRDPEECERQCCVPPGDKLGRTPCKLTQGAQCSPSEGLCCNSRCEYSLSTAVCGQPTECTEPTLCTGRASYCPLARPLPDSTHCAEGSRLCQDGKCSGSICQSLGMLPCSPVKPDEVAACQPHCHSPAVPCAPANHSYPDGTECGTREVYGYCGAGACLVGGDQTGRGSWMVGVIIFAIFYLVFVFIASWIYCRYCRQSTVTLLPVKSSKASSAPSSNRMIGHDSS